MKLKNITLSLLLLAQVPVVVAHDEQKVVVKHQCSCGPMEHVFYKLCVQRYAEIFPESGLVLNYDGEGLPANIVQALQMIVETLQFVDNDGNAIIPTVNAKGKLTLPMGKNSRYLALKKMLATVDTATTLSAEQLCAQWLQQVAAQ